MIRVLGNSKSVCGGISRREMLQIGGLSLLGLNLPGILRAEEQLPGSQGPGKAKSVILLYLFGGPAAQETFDPKTDAPAEYRGEFGSIPTSLPGVHFCEHLPRMAKWMNRSTLIRSYTHDSNDHSAGLLHSMTGLPPERLESLVPILSTQAPGMSAVMEYLSRNERRSIPASIWMPCYPGWGQQIYRPGPYAGFLGRKYDPWFTSCELTQKYEPRNFYDTQSEPVGRVTVPATHLEPGLTVDRLNQRASLAEQFDRLLDRVGNTEEFSRYDHYRKRALEILGRQSGNTSPWKAFDLAEEPASLRDRYGRHLYGEAALTARRLVERGVRFVTVSWESFEKQGSEPCSWDTHERHFPIMKDYHLPTLDQVYSALCEDLASRGLLDETLVVVMGEMGRAPKVNERGGRDHWSYLQNVLLTGAGVRKGLVHGASDAKGYGPTSHPVSAGDLIATIYAAMGIDTNTFIHDFTGRPRPMVPDGAPVRGVLT
jgi:hypothetical protein